MGRATEKETVLTLDKVLVYLVLGFCDSLFESSGKLISNIEPCLLNRFQLAMAKAILPESPLRPSNDVVVEDSDILQRYHPRDNLHRSSRPRFWRNECLTCGHPVHR
jgi:hypothetical protein